METVGGSGLTPAIKEATRRKRKKLIGVYLEVMKWVAVLVRAQLTQGFADGKAHRVPGMGTGPT